jgi:hypothetical protein
MTPKILKSYCGECNKVTNNDVLSEHSESHRDEYACDIHYQIIQCRGCDTKSFRKVFFDIEAAFPSSNDRWEVPEEITIYPKVVKGHKKLQDIYELPDIVRNIYSEILLALKEDAKVLAGLGLRTAVEAVCNDLKIPGRNLEIRINKLAAAGYISKNDAERLHGIRFMGNDAAHDIKMPKDEALSVALQIVEHLMLSVYVLEKKANGNIDTTISRYEVFQNMLDEKIIKYSVGDEYPIAKFFENDLRRVKESIATLEQELMARISSGDYKRLSVGKLDYYASSDNPVQHFIVIKG